MRCKRSNRSAPPSYAAIAARSYHPGGVDVALLDGSEHFIADDVDRPTWQSLSTRDLGEVVNVEL
ncbi:MAG: DUF1559 domain-containing protein [Bythopirellula sp.]